MERWRGKLAVVTGASAGIGVDICIELVKAGMKVIGLARRSEKVENLKNSLPEILRDNLIAMKCDVSTEEDILKAFKEIDEKYGAVSVLVNNAGVLAEGTLFERENAEALRNVINVNVMGLVFCTREAYLSMKKYGIDDGHIIHINSIAGHSVSNIPNHSFNIYAGSKHAVTGLTETYRQDLVKQNSKIKVTVSDQNVDLEFQLVLIENPFVLVDFSWSGKK